MGKVRAMDEYNYAAVVGDDDFLAFRSVLPVGSVAPNAAVTVAATGEPGLISDYSAVRKSCHSELARNLVAASHGRAMEPRFLLSSE